MYKCVNYFYDKIRVFKEWAITWVLLGNMPEGWVLRDCIITLNRVEEGGMEV
jgi:hypothetical protein